MNPVRRTSDLLIGRASIPGATYFLTMCEARRRPGLSLPVVVTAVRTALDDMYASGDGEIVAATIMPDHLHLLFKLGVRLSLPRLIGKFKSRTKAALATLDMAWQENFYEHRLRSSDELEPFARYIFLNPYRARLTELHEPWPYWWRWGEFRFRFEAAVADCGGVPPLWLGEPDPFGASDL